jgi:transposase-like protein
MENEQKKGSKNKRNGKNVKTVLTEAGKVLIETPRDRMSKFTPEIIGKRELTLSSGLDEQILALYAQGNSVEDVRRL